MQIVRQAGVFDPRESVRVASLAGVPLASFRRRFAAYLIDMILVFGTYGPAMAALRYLLFDILGMREDLYKSAHVQVRFEFQMVTEVAWVLWLVLYFGLCIWKTNGFTLGKRLMRIRVVSLEHERMTLWQSVERALGYGASALEAGFGFLQYFLYPNHRCLHDRIAETIVVGDAKGRVAILSPFGDIVGDGGSNESNGCIGRRIDPHRPGVDWSDGKDCPAPRSVKGADSPRSLPPSGSIGWNDARSGRH